MDTKLLENEILNASNVSKLFEKREGEFSKMTLRDYFLEMMRKYNVEKKDIIARADVAGSYAYEIIDGKKQPRRDKLIRICFGFPLTVSELQKALKYGGVNELYAKNKRDACIMFAAHKGYTVMQLNELLDKENEEIVQ